MAMIGAMVAAGNIWRFPYLSRKVEIPEHPDRMGTYSPEALAELRTWIEENPDDPVVDEAGRRYNDRVETLVETDRHFYVWDQSKIDHRERI